MNQHKKVLGIIYIATACLQLLSILIAYLLLSTIVQFVKNEISSDQFWILELVVSILQIIPWIIVLFISIPSVLAGIGLLNNQPWAMVMALILGCIKLFWFPIGTAIGIYTIWVYVESKKTEIEKSVS